jgi:hypothetical protein
VDETAFKPFLGIDALWKLSMFIEKYLLDYFNTRHVHTQTNH